MTTPLRVLATLQADPGRGADLVSAFEGVAPLVRAEEGCRRYDLHGVLGDPDTFVVLEEWDSREALDAHLASAHMAEYVERAAAYRSKPAIIVLLSHERVA